ncbi:HutD/Ves family protein [Streptomyces fuscigenes]|uniref:HutD/Ves family protein n=1 Tax=Streptomyces fuscigenes TaxID=1528880 RepID=UPI001F2F2209|nr:HutD family protein [Streptomyces fuscigenes]MCF3963867.1 HutD family protein [Streptomyces fuscigenes]
MATAVLREGEYPRVPWKNGGGTTREVAARASGDGAGFDWRVSVADVAAEGPFSPFPGVDRVITLVDGDGMVLTVDGAEHRLEPLGPFAFPGDAATDCRLPGGPARDLNLMTRRGRASGSVRVSDVSGGLALDCADGETLLLLPVTGGLALDTGAEAAPLARLDCVRHDGAGTVRLTGRGRVAVIRVAPAR